MLTIKEQSNYLAKVVRLENPKKHPNAVGETEYTLELNTFKDIIWPQDSKYCLQILKDGTLELASWHEPHVGFYVFIPNNLTEAVPTMKNAKFLILKHLLT